MTGGQLANALGSALATITSGVFIVTWSAVGKWWRTSTGRFMVMKASAICAAGVLTVALTFLSFQSDVDWLRYVLAAIWTSISIAFVHHTVMVWKINRKG